MLRMIVLVRAPPDQHQQVEVGDRRIGEVQTHRGRFEQHQIAVDERRNASERIAREIGRSLLRILRAVDERERERRTDLFQHEVRREAGGVARVEEFVHVGFPG